MLRRMLVAILVTVAVVAVSIAASATDSQPTRRQPASHGTTAGQPILGAPSEKAGSCGLEPTRRTLRCLNRRILALGAWVYRFSSCLEVWPVNQYGEDSAGGTYGYVWRDPTYYPDSPEWLTTGLDLREPDDTYAPDFWSVAWVCGVNES